VPQKSESKKAVNPYKPIASSATATAVVGVLALVYFALIKAMLNPSSLQPELASLS
jgi:hypothetical protein